MASTARVLIVTDAQDDGDLIDVLAAGIADLVARQRGERRILSDGGPRILELVGSSRPDTGVTLTPRQIEVLRPLAQGMSNKEIARAIGVSPATVKTHVAQLIAILGAANRTDAAIRARERALI